MNMTDLKRIFGNCQDYQISYLLKAHDIPHRYEGRNVYVAIKDLNNWLAERRYRGKEKEK